MRLIRAVFVALATACTSTSSVSGISPGFGSESGTPTIPPGGRQPNISNVPTQPACPDPSSMPNEGDPCDGITSTACEYGDAALPACDEVLECVQIDGNFEWRRSVDQTAVCASCPSDFGAITPGGACNESGAICTYYEATCGCVGGSDAGDPDAGAGTWSCTRPALGCPARRPRLGESCVHPMTCDYGSCEFGASLTFTCARIDSRTAAWTAADPPTCP